MTVVNIIGNSDDKALEEIILSRLPQISNSYKVTYIKDKSIVQVGKGYEITIADFDELKSLQMPECIIIMKSKGPVPLVPLPKKSIIIANSENVEQLSSLKAVGCTVITCGSNEKDTLSYSSITADRIVISLNREIVAFSGRKIQPLEIPLKFDRELSDIYYPIAFTALRLILDDVNSELGRLT